MMLLKADAVEIPVNVVLGSVYFVLHDALQVVHWCHPYDHLAGRARQRRFRAALNSGHR